MALKGHPDSAGAAIVHRWLLAVLVLCLLAVPVAHGDGDPFGDMFEANASFHLDADGTGVHIVGELQPMTAMRFRWFLWKNPGIRNVILSSGGGAVEPGMRLGRLIRKKGLDTYTIYACYSACTYAFAGGKTRYVVEGSGTGFHSHGLKEEFQVHSDQLKYYMRVLGYQVRRHFRRMGVSEEMIRRIDATPLEDIWEPDPEYLVRQGYADRVLKQTESPWRVN